jgi:hypothetical protein
MTWRYLACEHQIGIHDEAKVLPEGYGYCPKCQRYFEFVPEIHEAIARYPDEIRRWNRKRLKQLGV